MARARTIPRERTGRWLFGGLAVAVTCVVSGCDSAVGIPGDEPEPAASSTNSDIAEGDLTPEAGQQQTSPGPQTETATAVAGPPVGPVPGNPEAAAAVQRWAVDLATDTPDQLAARCWTIPPLTAAAMYADKQAILATLEQPGTDGRDSTTWRGRGTTVVAEHRAIDSGYACPRVYPAGTEPGLDAADARHTVRRYLARSVGKPLDPADQETDYPLVCTASPADWDPTGGGRAAAAPLADHPGKLTGVDDYADQDITSENLRGAYVEVEAAVTTTTGGPQTRTFTLRLGDEGYCIGDVSS